MADINVRTAKAYAEFKNSKVEHLLNQMREVLSTFRVDVPERDAAEEDAEDRVFAGLLASHLMSYSLRPRAMRSEKEVAPLVARFQGSRFVTELRTEDVARMIAESRAMLRGHFELVNRDHSEHFFMFSKLGGRVDFRSRLSRELAERFKQFDIETVVSPVSAGGLLAQDIATELGCGFAFFDIDHQSRPCARVKDGYVIEGRTLIVNDMATTGTGLSTMVDAVSSLSNAKLVGVGLVAARGPGGRDTLSTLANNSIRVEVLVDLLLKQYKKDNCRICSTGVPPTFGADINR